MAIVKQAPSGGIIFTTERDPREPILAHNRLSIAGSAVARVGIESIKVRIAGREFTASYGLPATDVASEFAEWPDAAHSKFELGLDTSTWTRGELPFEVVAIDRKGGSASLAGVADVQPYESPPFGDAEAIEALAAGRPAMWCETPDLFIERTGEIPLALAGWASFLDGIETVLVTVDGRLRVSAIHGLLRPDLRNRLGDGVAADAGFAIRLDPAECPAGWHELTVVAVGSDGRGLGVSGMVNCLPADSGGSPDSPSALSTSSAEFEHLTDGRFVPELHRGQSFEPEHYARYGWAASLVDGLKVLDAGCGVGWGTARLAARAKQAIGMDLSPVALAEAIRRYGDEADFREGDLCRMPFEDGEFDAVVSFEAIEHVDDPEQALDEMRRVLSPQGTLLISSPNRGIYPEGNPFHLHEFTSEEFEAALKARFKNVAVHRQQTYFASLLGTDATLELDDPSVPVEAHLTKLSGGPPGTELYAVVAATDKELPPFPARVVLGRGIDHDDQRRQTEMWHERAVRAEADAAASRTEANLARRMERLALEQHSSANGSPSVRTAEIQRDLEIARAANVAIQASLSWRLTAPLRAAKRVARKARPR